MITTSPGKITITTEAGLPSGAAVGFQLVVAGTGLVAIARTTAGVIERPIGSGNYVINFTAPIDGDLYLLVVDWSAGVLDPTTTRVEDVLVTAEVQIGSSGMGAIADYVKMHLGGNTWKGLNDDPEYGPAFITRAIELVKARALAAPPATVNEVNMHPLVLDYLGVLASLQLITAARDYWMSQVITTATGNDPVEIVTYANRAQLIDTLRDDLMRSLPAAQDACLPYIDAPIKLASGGPMIDEDSDFKVTEDPRDFPNIGSFPGGPMVLDAYGRGGRRTGTDW